MLKTVLATLLVMATIATLSTPQVSAQSASSEFEVRVVARLLHSDEIEFVVQHRRGGVWSKAVRPRKNRFPSDPDIGRWYVSAPVSLGKASVRGTAGDLSKPLQVRITARRLTNGTTEFALQVAVDIAPNETGQVTEWTARVQPRLRFFPVSATTGRWLPSSPITMSELTEPLSQPAREEANRTIVVEETASNAQRLEKCGQLSTAHTIWWHSDRAQLTRDFPELVQMSRQYTAEVANGRCTDTAIRVGCSKLRSAYTLSLIVEASGISPHEFADSSPETSRQAQAYWLIRQYSRCLR